MEQSQRKKKTSMFKLFLLPLIGIMLIQSIITIGTLVVRRATGMLEDYSVSLMTRLVENRKTILENEMTQRWSSVSGQEMLMNGIMDQFLKEKEINLQELMESDTLRDELLGRFFPECIDLLQKSNTTGIFFVFTSPDAEKEEDLDGFLLRASDPDTSPAGYTDMLLERGNKYLSREWDVPLDTNWTTHFHMSGMGRDASENFFYEPWRAGEEYKDAAAADLGYWSEPFLLEKDGNDSHEMITYSLPLRYRGQVYGVMGVEVSTRYLCEYLPAAELNENQQSGYMLAIRQSDGNYKPLTGKGVLYSLVCSSRKAFGLLGTDHENLSQIQDVRLDEQDVYAVLCPLKLYGNNVPYENTEWTLIGLNTEDDIFGMGRQLYIWIFLAILIGLGFGVVGIYFVVKHLTGPMRHLMKCISKGSSGLQEFKPTNILEIDALYDVVNELTKNQKEAENILLEEKERYRVALDSTKDVFFSYDLHSHILDIVNHKTKSGQWQCDDFESGFIDPESIHDMDRMAVIRTLQSTADKLYVEFRMSLPESTDYKWVALSGKVVYDADGNRRKLVGSIRDIQEQKEREAEQLRKSTTDGVTGLYVFSAGMERLKECRKDRQNGVMIDLFMYHLKETNEKNGIVFGDMLLEEIGNLTRQRCHELTMKTNYHTVALRLDGDEFVLWLENQTREQAEEFIKDLQGSVSRQIDSELFDIDVLAGLALAESGQNTEKLICMAKLARRLVTPAVTGKYLFYEDIPKRKRTILPVLQGREVNTLDYNEDVSLVSLALNLFGKGADFPAQMLLMIQKIGRVYQASDVLISVWRPDFNSNYLDYQWHREGDDITDCVRKYKEENKEEFFGWLGSVEVRCFTVEDSMREAVRCFLSVEPGQQGIVLPMYDNGNYMGNICMIGIGSRLLESAEEYQNLAELGRVIQSQMNQQQHDIASKAKSDFLSRMSHEIRTPMNGIIGMTAIALQQGQSEERIVDCLQKIQASSNYLLGLINDILDMSKIESGKMKLEPVNFSMQEMLDTITELIKPQVTDKEIVFERKIDLPHTWFYADRMRISQVLINLLGNAVKFTPHRGRITLSVQEVSAKEKEAKIYFAVQDTGVGIAREDQDRVFRSFEQASGANPSKQHGTGLGLSISSRLVQLMGSNIQLDSALGEGSTFSFAISLGLGENVETEKKEEEFSFDGFRILVVEDNELNAEIAQSLLEERNFKVDCVHDGAQAVERMKNTQPNTYDVILMDILMPVMDGLEATRAIRSMDREDCRTVPIIAMSANAFDDDLKKSVECGMNGHLSKPVEVDKLYRTLREVLGKGAKRITP